MHDVLDILSDSFVIENSKARTDSQYSNQKVLFKLYRTNAGELEIRTDSSVHYKEIKLRFNAEKVTSILKENVSNKETLKHNIFIYNKAIKKFMPKHK